MWVQISVGKDGILELEVEARCPLIATIIWWLVVPALTKVCIILQMQASSLGRRVPLWCWPDSKSGAKFRGCQQQSLAVLQMVYAHKN